MRALDLAKRGWPVFPCAGKAPLTSNGYKAATTDEAQIRRWAERHPGCNWGIACGASGLFVVDVDPRNGGHDQLAALVMAHAPADALETFRVRTGGGGLQFYFRDTEPGAKRRKQLAPGVDIKAKGGYVIAPGSVTAAEYTIEDDRLPADLPIWIAELARKGNSARPPEPDLDVAAVRRRLLAVTSADSRQLMEALLQGRSIGVAGQRDNLVQRAASVMAFAAPASPLEILLELARPSLQVWANEPGAELTLDEELAKFREKLARARMDWETKQESIVYSQDELAQIAREQGCSIDQLGRRWILRLRTASAVCILEPGGYTRPTLKDNLRTELHDRLRRAPFSKTSLDRNGAPKQRTLDDILGAHATVAQKHVADMSLSRSHFDGETFFEAVCPPRRLEALYDERIDTWLGLLGGEGLRHWISGITRLDRQTVAPYLIGEPGAGKTLLAAGLARIWTEAGPTSIEDVLGRFSDALQDCPLVFADESLPDDVRTSASLRRVIGSSEHRFERKGLPATRIRGCLRVMLAANHELLVFAKEELGVDDQKALGARILRIPIGPAPAAYLTEIGGYAATKDWVRGDLIARHALWLVENVGNMAAGARFLTSGNLDPQELALNHPDVGRVLEVILKTLEPGAETVFSNRAKSKTAEPAVIMGGGEICVAGGQLIWGDDRQKPTLNWIASTLRKLQVDDKDVRPHGGVRYRRIRADLFLKWLERVGGDVERFRAEIERPKVERRAA